MSDRSSTKDEASAERSPWSRPSVLLSGAFLLALVLLGVVVATTGGGAGTNDPARTPTAAAPSTPTKATASGCVENRAGSQSVPSSSPPQARWGTVGSMQVPQNPTVYGPERSDGPWETCFAHNPTGALLAAMNLWAEGTAADPSAVFAHLAIGAPADLGNSARLDAGGPVQFAGYRYESYDPTTARLLVVIRGPEGKLAAAETTMTWVAGDWKYLFPPGGAPSIEVISDLTGYVPWSAF
jgi:hypothetical protein